MIREVLKDQKQQLKVSDLHFLMALAEINRVPHWCFNLAVETINSIPLVRFFEQLLNLENTPYVFQRDQKRFFLSAFREVLRRRVTGKIKR